MAEQEKPVNQNQVARLDQQIAQAKSVKDLFEMVDVKSRAIKGYEATTGRKDGENRFQQERFAYLELIHQKPELRQAPMWTHFKVINKVMHSGLSLRDNKLYVQAVKKGDEVVDIKVDPSPAGRREMLEMMPNVKSAPEAQIVLKGDLFLHDKLNNRIIKHEMTEKSETSIKLDNILYSYQRIIWKDNSVTDIVVPHDDLVQAKKKSKIKSTDAGLWVEFPGEASKKTATNRAFNRYHKYPDNAIILDEVEETKDIPHSEEPDYPEVDSTVVTTASGENVDTNTGEVQQKSIAEEVHAEEVTKNPKKKKEQQDLNLL
jgi:recombinational DNA repair protein RecT